MAAEVREREQITAKMAARVRAILHMGSLLLSPPPPIPA
jgi:hypothetical protein